MVLFIPHLPHKCHRIEGCRPAPNPASRQPIQPLGHGRTWSGGFRMLPCNGRDLGDRLAIFGNYDGLAVASANNQIGELLARFGNAMLPNGLPLLASP